MTSDLNPSDLIIVSDDDSGHGMEVHIPDTPQSDDLKYQVQKELEKLDSSLDSAMDAVLMSLNINPQQSKDTDLSSRPPCYCPCYCPEGSSYRDHQFPVAVNSPLPAEAENRFREREMKYITSEASSNCPVLRGRSAI